MKLKITCREIDDNVLSMTSTSSPITTRPPHPILIARLIDDNVMKPLTMLANRCQCYENDDNVMTYETDDNAMKPQITYCEIDDNVLSMASTSSFHHKPPTPV